MDEMMAEVEELDMLESEEIDPEPDTFVPYSSRRTPPSDDAAIRLTSQNLVRTLRGESGNLRSSFCANCQVTVPDSKQVLASEGNFLVYVLWFTSHVLWEVVSS